ncbi:hypothetical protein A2661_02940 [Candidatus Giovannonibacteria bacterium RIFCSPHIGHO2_01_FULL_45_24]|uniref:Uncharacterized protein n=1 Tax=Candidatus Giovannonibacteria bacterium RIFCSPLOWO2_01_FULL_46_32 TaxID=1798353 RepID=A0A1F5XGH3_9BACT|nr:MAG: hypothetical protein A2661_02940 [Candidatus Giovannonibacteria bacterium RIFCSPHIGHO2_01_FULL_45_24]OGF86969.1 MAG: hypothetical protein A3B19_00860 [Candidatus Giovannonibacteria bacterium RIFCSPLOWO2_01_FULL_46_32]
MQLNKQKFALAAAAVMSGWSVICAVLVAIAPNLALTLFSWMVHLVNLKAGVSFPGAIYGIIEVFILTYITAYAFALLHNKFIQPKT